MRRRSNLLVLLGVVSFVLGLLAVYLITDEDDDGAGAGGGSSDVATVVVAAAPLQAGARGEDVLREQRYRVEQVPLAERQPDAISTPSQLSGAVLTLSFAEGEQIRTGGLRTLGGPRAVIPEGKEAVSVTVDFVAGGASSVLPGDRVNVFLVLSAAVSSTGADDSGQPVVLPLDYAAPRAELLLTNTLVLDVQQSTSPLQVTQPQPGTTTQPTTTSSLIFVLAVDTTDAEKVIFAAQAPNADLYFSRVRLDDQNNPSPPVESTPGADFGSILAEEAGAAFRRSDG